MPFKPQIKKLDYYESGSAGSGDALTTDPLSQFAATTSLQLKGVISDETGSGALVFGTSPVITTPTGIVKGDVGLGNVDNTSDASKPVSTAQQTALDLKANLASPALTGNPTAPTQSAGNNSTRLATTAYADALVADAINNGVTGIAPSQNSVFDALALKSDTSHSHLLSAITDVTASITELNYIDGVTSAIQTQLDGKQASLGFTAENVANKDTDVSLAADSDTKYPSQKAIKAYVDGVASGLSIKASVQLGTAAALPANTYSNGASGVGATLTGVATGVLTVDGTAVALNDRILVKDEVTAANNGIYVCTIAGAIGVAYVLTRATSSDTATEIPGSFTFVEGGTANSGGGFVVASAGPFTMGTTAINWTQFSGAGEITAGAALTKSGNTLDVAVDGSSIEVSSDALRVKALGITNAMLAGSIAASKLVGSDIATVGTITSGVWNGTDIAVADGGTGASTAADARTNLGLVIGTNVQAYDADLDAWSGKTAPSGTVVGTSDTQTLTNKEISGGVVESNVFSDIVSTQNITLPAGRDFKVLDSFEMAATHTIEIPSTTTLEASADPTENIEVLTAGWDGWTPANETWTYSSADSPTGIVTSSKDASLKYSGGMRFKFKQGGVQKYAICTVVSASTITMCMSMASPGGAADNSGLENATITDIYYSTMKAPLNFPISPLRWTIQDTDNTEQTQASPTAGTWYNVGTNTISVPIGLWDIGYEANVQFVKASSTVSSIYSTLSTANNTNADPEFQCNIYAQVLANSTASVFNLVTRHKVISLTAKTSYYLNLNTEVASAGSIEIRGDRGVTVLRAVLAYL